MARSSDPVPKSPWTIVFLQVVGIIAGLGLIELLEKL